MPNAVTNNTLARFQPSENRSLSTALMGIEEQLEAAARQNLEHVLAEQNQGLGDFTDTEVLAMVTIEKLRLVNGMDLATILLRGKLFNQIEQQGLFTVHPSRWQTLEAMANEIGVSISELSDIRVMTQVIFPYLEDTLRIPVAQVWETIGKAKFRALCPILNALITGEPPDRGQTRANFDRIVDTTAIEMRGRNPDVTEEEIRRQAVSDLIAAGQVMPVRELQEHIRDGNPTPSLAPTILVLPDGRQVLISEIDDDQLTVVRRKLGRHIEQPVVVELPHDHRAAQREALRHAIIRDIYRTIDG